MSTTPNFASTPNVSWVSLAAANNVYDGTGTVGTVFTAGASGAYVGFIKMKPLGTNAVTVARIFLNNGSTNATAANNALIGEVPLPLTTAATVSALTEMQYPIGFAIPAGYKINVVLSVAVSTGWVFVAASGDL